MKRIALLCAAIAVVTMLVGCGGGGPNTPPVDTAIRVEYPIAGTWGPDSGADVVGTQVWRLYGDRPGRPVDLQQVDEAMIVQRLSYNAAGDYTEWRMTAVSSWRTDLNVVRNGKVIQTIFVVTEWVDDDLLHISVAGATKTGESSFDAGEVTVTKSLRVSWQYDEPYDLSFVPVVWYDLPDGATLIKRSEDGRDVEVGAIRPGTYTVAGDVAGKVFTVSFTRP